MNDKELTLKNLRILHKHMVDTCKTPRMIEYFETDYETSAYSLENGVVKSHVCGSAACLLGEATMLEELPVLPSHVHGVFSIINYSKTYFPYLHDGGSCNHFGSRWLAVFSDEVNDDKAVNNLKHYIDLWENLGE